MKIVSGVAGRFREFQSPKFGAASRERRRGHIDQHLSVAEAVGTALQAIIAEGYGIGLSS